MVMIAGFAVIAPFLRADNQPPPVDSGYKMVPIAGANGKVSYIRVQDQSSPSAHLSSSSSDGQYDPSQISLNKTSNLANKSFPTASLYQNHSAEEARQQRTFITKPFFAGNDVPSDRSVSNFNTKLAYPAVQGYNRTAEDTHKAYLANQTNADQNKSARLSSAPSEYQNRSAYLGNQKANVYASPLAHITYTGPGVNVIKKDMNKVNVSLMQAKDLPNRPLTIDEVRDLINNGIKPDTDVHPAASQSKPLNDPGYEPGPPPPPLAHSSPSPAPALAPAPSSRGDSSDGDLPSPGAMAAQHLQQEQPPENSEPLPK